MLYFYKSIIIIPTCLEIFLNSRDTLSSARLQTSCSFFPLYKSLVKILSVDIRFRLFFHNKKVEKINPTITTPKISKDCKDFKDIKLTYIHTFYTCVLNQCSVKKKASQHMTVYSEKKKNKIKKCNVIFVRALWRTLWECRFFSLMVYRILSISMLAHYGDASKDNITNDNAMSIFSFSCLMRMKCDSCTVDFLYKSYA